MSLTEEELLHESVHGLRDRSPDSSASVNLTARQRIGLRIIGVFIAIGFVVRPLATGIVLVGLASTVYFVVLMYRLILFARSLDGSQMVRVNDDAARAVPPHDLPVYTVLVPAYREPEVLADLVRALERLDYPRSKLDVMLLLESDDMASIVAADWAITDPFIQVVKVPVADPRTKPKALNYGLQLARGEFVTVFDAEDRPDPLQLRKAVLAMRAAPPELACLQARLSYFNPDQNLITRWFAMEYETWFNQFLPGLVASDAPVPLGGTSNHFRRSVLEEVGAWDPFNVTEDADLGLRLHRLGYRTAVLDSVTWEEANSDFVNWIKQRSRWYKGYLQTWSVHMRHPAELYKRLGLRAFLEFNLFVGGTPILAMLNPLFWAMSILWFVSEPLVIQLLLPVPVYYMALFCWIGGNFMLTYLNVLVAQEMGGPRMHRAGLASPLYWIMMSIAAIKAGVQFIFQPTHWEKTVHGLTGQRRHQ